MDGYWVLLGFLIQLIILEIIKNRILAYLLNIFWNNSEDDEFKDLVKNEQVLHEEVIKSLKSHRDNSHAHNDLNYSNSRIEAGVERLYEWLESVILRIKEQKPHLKNCNAINLSYNEKLAMFAVQEIFEGFSIC